jgi:hypothetical protein
MKGISMLIPQNLGDAKARTTSAVARLAASFRCNLPPHQIEIIADNLIASRLP